MSWTSLNSVCALYTTLTALKLGQWVGFYFSRQRRQLEKKAEHVKAHVEYSPSLAVVLYVLEILMGEGHPGAIPREELRAVTDPWLRDYRRLLQGDDDPIKNNKRPPKKFSSLRSATCNFYKEFTQETSAIMVHFTKSSLGPFLAHPLGLICALELFMFVIGSLLLFVWEILVKDGNSQTFICKMAASMTANEVYVVSTLDHSLFDDAMHKYPWLSGIFSHQIHPMVGRVACPLYRREFPLPQKDVMDFEIDVIPTPSGTLILRQKHTTFWGNVWEDLLLSQVTVLSMGVYLVHTYGISDVLGVMTPYVAVFYAVRSVADWSMGIQWLERYRWLV